MSTELDVLVVGAGPSGLTLACDLLRRGVRVRVVSAATGGFPGSRAKGVQPRTQEVLDDLGVLAHLATRATTYPKLGVHLGPVVIPKTMIALHESTDAVPHANTLLVAQHDTDDALRTRLSELGGTVEYDTRFLSLTQDLEGVTAELETPDGRSRVRAGYLVGADGGSSPVRTGLGIAFPGTTDDSDRMIVADLVLTGLPRNRWHVWPGRGGRFMALCPMPSGPEAFQLMLKLGPDAELSVDRDAIEGAVLTFTGTRGVAVRDVLWSSIWRPNIRIAERYRDGRVLLVGDAAHVHPPTGAQGLNTGVQDAYNLGWKLGQVLAGAPDALLDTYEAERQPVAARVLGLSSELYANMRTSPTVAMKRGDEERQLSLSYRAGPLAAASDTTMDGVLAGDRLPGFLHRSRSGVDRHIFEDLRGPGFTLIALGSAAAEAVAEVAWPSVGAGLTTIVIDDVEAARVAAVLGTSTPAHILVRPDGYVAYVANRDWADSAVAFAELALP